ncbi:cytochrome P450 [Micromonospora sp. NPDC001898]|uniref:cytochrome P450 n=1 Tax=Micromonospora sp. NPDC001898 TaxID=3364221 RepID=UPI00367B7421
MAIPDAPRRIPVIGHAAALLSDPLGYLATLPAHGDVLRLTFGPVRIVVVCDPELTRRVLVDDRTYDKGGPSFDSGLEEFGDGLASCPHSRHRRRRRLAQPSFHHSRYPGYARVMTDHIDTATAAWRPGQVLDVRAEMASLSMSIAVATMFSSSMPADRLRQAVGDLQTLVSGIHRTMLLPPALTRLPLPVNQRYRRAVTRLRQTIGAIVAERRAHAGEHDDLLASLLAARDDQSDTPSSLTENEAVDEVMTFFAAGSETIANTLAWSLYLLSQDADVRARQRAEVEQVLTGDVATFEDISKLELTTRIVTESLRLYPPAWIVTRAVTADTELGGHPIPAGTFVAWSPYLLQRRADLYEEPDRFRPDRWDATRCPAPPRSAFVSFGGGARKCIGDQFSYVEATLALATITRRWILDPVPGARVTPAASTTLYPKNLRMRLVREAS